MLYRLFARARVATLSLATALCFGAILLTASYPPDTTANMERKGLSGAILSLQDSLGNDNPAEAARWADLLDAKWKSERPGLRWRVFGSALDDVDISLARLRAAVRVHDLNAAMVESAELMIRVRDLKR